MVKIASCIIFKSFPRDLTALKKGSYDVQAEYGKIEDFRPILEKEVAVIVDENRRGGGVGRSQKADGSNEENSGIGVDSI